MGDVHTAAANQQKSGRSTQGISLSLRLRENESTAIPIGGV